MLYLICLLIFAPGAFLHSPDRVVDFVGNGRVTNVLSTSFKYERFGNSSYKYHQDPKRPVEAMRICEAEGAHLAVLNSVEEANFVMSMMERFPNNVLSTVVHKDYILIGFHDAFGNDDYMTIHGQSLESSGYAKWNFGEPNGGDNENCGSLHRNGGFNDVPCTIRLPYICEMPLTGCLITVDVVPGTEPSTTTENYYPFSKSYLRTTTPQFDVRSNIDEE